MKGICGRLLDIDLTSGKSKEIGISDETPGNALFAPRTTRQAGGLGCVAPVLSIILKLFVIILNIFKTNLDYYN
mgnify:CR=1 FL=1